MPRKSIFAAVGNPVNRKTIPKVRLRLSFPTQVGDIADDRARTLAFLCAAIGFSLVAYVCLIVFFGVIKDEGVQVFLLGAICAILLARKTEFKLGRILLPPMLWSVIAPFAMHSIPTEPLVAGSIVALLYLVWQYRRHYASVTKHTGWAKLKRPRVRRKWSVIAAFDAWDSFLQYGRFGTDIPGMQRSAAGSRTWRLTVVIVTLLFLLFTFTHVAFAVVPIHLEMPQEDLILLAILLLVAHVAPLIILLFSSYLLSFWMLGLCYAIKLSESDPARFAEAFPALCKELKRVRERKR